MVPTAQGFSRIRVKILYDMLQECAWIMLFL